MGAMAITLRGLQLDRPARKDAPAWRLEVGTFSAACGARIGLVGESGAGKSTLLDILALIRSPGRVQQLDLFGEAFGPALTLGHEKVLTRARRRHISYILQDGGLLPWLSVGANAQLARLLSGNTGPGLADLARHLGIEALLKRRPADLSGGQRQRAAVLRGLASGAALILADEPTAALDAENAARTLQMLYDLPPDRTVIVASHDRALLRACGFALCEVVLTRDDSGAQTARLRRLPDAEVAAWG